MLILEKTFFICRYISAATCGFKERQRRAISIEVLHCSVKTGFANAFGLSIPEIE